MEILDDDILGKQELNAQSILKMRSEFVLSEKEVRYGRNALVALIVFQIIGLIYDGVTSQWNTMYLMIDAIFVVVYIVLYAMSEEKPYFSLLAAVVIYSILTIIIIIGDPIELIKGILVKGLIFYYLIKGLIAAKKYIKTKELLRLNNIKA